jgi:hypothetical protein
MATQISSLTTLVNGVNSYDCFLPLVDPTLALDSRNVKVRISTHNEMFSNNFAVANLSSYGNYFGTGKDGSVTISSSAQISSSTSPAGLNNISGQFGDTIVKNYQNLTINGGVLFTPLRACRGMVIYCTGNLTVNGTLSMTGKGGGVVTKIAAPIGIASSTDSRYDLVDATLYFNNFSSSTAGGYGIPTHWNWAPSGSIWFSNYKIRVPLSGSVAGGTAGAANGGVGGTGTAGTFCCGGGGGGGGGGNSGAAGAAGGRGSIFAGGGGGGGSAFQNFGTGPGGVVGLLESGGSGGNAVANAGGGGGGAGNPAGSGGVGVPTAVNGLAGGIGVGGLIVLIVRGNISITGTISNNGINGGNGVGSTSPATYGAGAGGGGSGGGRTVIIYGGTYSNAGSVVANGGSGGSSSGGGSPVSGAGGAGGAGAITVRRVHI